MSKKRANTDPFKDLTWTDLEDRAGASVVSRGRSYQRSGHVQDLARTPGGGVIAWVHGTYKYATQVDFDGTVLVSTCTCPYWGDVCKHAIAVVLEYLESVKNKSEVPTIKEQDQRLALLQELGEPVSDGDIAFEEDGADDSASRRSRHPAVEKLSPYLAQQTQVQLIELLEELSGRFPAVLKALQDRRDLAEGTAEQLVKSVEKEIRALGAEPGWQNYWDGEGYTPDYSGVRDRLEVLLDRGQADEVVALGEELLETGIQLVEMSHDEGETAGEIISCLNVVFRALAQSSLDPAKQILWAVEAELSDEYDLCQGTEVFWEAAEEFALADWNVVADELAQRLKKFQSAKVGDGFSRSYQRDRVSNWLIHALEKAGREDEIIPLCEREAEKTGSYVRLIEFLKEAGRWEEAERWIRQGIQATQKQWPGIAYQLRGELRQMREKEKDWLRVAAFQAEDFFREPTLHTLEELRQAAEQAEVWPAVKAAAMRYLETGELPRAETRSTKDRAIPPWPLPDTGLAEEGPRWQPQFPVTHTLIDLAIAENRMEDVIHWYDRRPSQSNGLDWGPSVDEKVADAIAETHPEHALAIWKNSAEAHIARTNTSAYQTAAGYLLKVHQLLKKAGREKEWQAYLAELRQAHARKRRLLEILDNLTGKRIIDG